MNNTNYRKLCARHVDYEWIVETIVRGDIEDTRAVDSLADALTEASGDDDEIALVRDSGTESKGLDERSWAYFDRAARTLPETFDDGNKVPVKYLREAARHK